MKKAMVCLNKAKEQRLTKRAMRGLMLMVSCVLIMGLAAGCTTGGGKIKVGITQFGPHASMDNCRNGFIEGLKQDGYVDGENIAVDFKDSNFDGGIANSIAQDFVAKNYNLIGAIATPSAQAAYNAAEEKGIPVVFCAVSDPVLARIVDSLEKPGHHATGTSDLLPIAKQLEMIRAFMPDAKNIGILYSIGEINSTAQLEEYERVAPDYGFTIVKQGVSSTADIPLAADRLLTQVDALTNLTDNTVVGALSTVLQKANEKHIPIFGSEIEQVEKGCVATVGIDYFELGIQTGKIAARILKGEKPADIPVLLITDSTVAVSQQAMDFFGLSLPEQYAGTSQVIS